MIDSLTPEQIAKFDYYKDKWINIGLNTDPCDFEASKAHARQAYEYAGLVCPEEFFLADSPKQAIEMIYERYKPDNKNDIVEATMFGNQEACWLSYYDFMLNELNIEACRPITGLMKLAETCGWWHGFEDAVFFQHRPLELHLENNVLHNESGPAVLYRDGYALYSINGHTVTEQIVMRPETLTISQIDGETNSDIQSIMIDRYGWPKYLKVINAKCIDTRDNDVEGTKEALYATPKHGKRLVVTCTTGRMFVLGVPDNITKCDKAQSWMGPQELVNTKVKSFNVIART